MTTEQDMEAFLVRMAPGLQQEWEGASVDDIAKIRELAGGQELPPFYRWLLSKVGRNAGSLPDVFRALYARNVIDAYDDEFDPHPPALFIARLDHPVMPIDLFYDLSVKVRDDARVNGHESMTGAFTESTETLREWLVWFTLVGRRINTSSQVCTGTFTDRSGDVAAQLRSVMGSLGFSVPVAMGRFCLVFERADAALACRVSAEPRNAYMLAYRFGGPDAVLLRRVLGEIAHRTQVQVMVRDWTPQLAAL